MRKFKDFLKSRSGFTRKLHRWNYDRIERSRKARRESEAAMHEGNLVVLGIMKNEAMVVEEWIQHHLDQGADKVVLIDNGSTDASVQLAMSDKFSGKVECVSRTEKWRQTAHYWNVIQELKLRQRFRWLLIADLDEFWFCKDGVKISDALPDEERIDLIYVRMTYFGSSGHVKQPSSVRQSFTIKDPKPSPFEYTKYIVRLSALKSGKQIGIHKVHSISSARTVGDDVRFQLNHYIIQSREYFETVKMTRGDACNPVKDKDRDWSYFENADKVCTVEDTQLIEMIKKSKFA